MSVDMFNSSIPNNSEIIKETSDNAFEQDVMAGSINIPIVVEFYPTLNMQCKPFSNMLEKHIKAAGGKVLLRRVSVEHNPMLLQALQIQAVPTVYAFYQGRAVDGFAGMKPEAEVKAFIDRLSAMSGAPKEEKKAGGLSPEEKQKIRAKADELYFGCNYEQAFEAYSHLLEEEGEGNAEVLGCMGWCSFMNGDFASVEEIVASMTDEAKQTPKIKGLLMLNELHEEFKKSDLKEMQAKADKGTNNDRFKLAKAYAGKGDIENAIATLLLIIQKERNWQDGKAKDFLVELFDAVGSGHPLVIKGKRRLSSVLFS